MPDEALKLAVVADIHYGRNDETKYGEKALELLDSVLTSIGNSDPALLIDLGDRITDQDPDTDQQLAQAVADRFRRCSIPRRHMLGNHDLEYLSVELQEDLLDTRLSHDRIHVKGWDLVFWQGNAHYHGGNLSIPTEDLEWLADELARVEYPAVVFTHVPLGSGSMLGNYYFERNPEGRAQYYNTERARNLLTESDAVVLSVAGHTHWNTVNTIDGVHFITVQSLSESYNTHPAPALAWATIILGETLLIEVHGNDRIKLELVPRRQGFHSLKRPHGSSSMSDDPPAFPS